MVRFLLLICFLPAQVLFAQQVSTAWKTVNEQGYSFKTVEGDPMRARFYKLANGLTVIMSVNKKQPRLQSIIAIRAGSNSDPRNHTGLAHYLEHMLFKGTDKYGTMNWAKEKPVLDSIQQLYETYNHTTDPKTRASIYKKVDQTSGRAARYAIANEYDKMMASMGAQGSNASTWYEYTNYYEDIPTTSIDKYLAVQAERFRNPVFRIFHTELEAVYEEKNMSLDSDPDKMQETEYASLFPTHNYGQQTTIGTIEHLKNPSLTEIRNFYNTYYVPNNMALIMCGDFNPDELIRKIDQYFGYLTPKDVKDYHPAPEQPLTAPIFKEVFGPDAEEVEIAFRLPGAVDSRTELKMEMVESLLSNGKAGLIDINLNKKQLVLGASASNSPYRDYSVFVLRGRPRNEQNLESVRDLLLEQIGKIKSGDFDETLMKAVVANHKLNELEALSDNESRAFQLFSDFIIDRNEAWPEIVSGNEIMAAFSKKEIIDFANEVFNQNYVCVYKRVGEDKDVAKVQKPPITPVALNRETQSPFLKSVNAMPTTTVNPQWLDFSKDFERRSIQGADLLYVRNKDNGIFRLSYRFNLGVYNERKLAIAALYLQYLGAGSETAEDITREFYGLASSYTLGVDKEFTTVTLTGLQENMSRSIALLEKLLSQCKVDDTAFISLKARIVKSRADNKLNKNLILRGLRYYAAYGPKNPFNSQVSNAALNTLKPQELVDLLHELLNYKHTIIYYGPLSIDSAAQMISHYHPLPDDYKVPATPEKFSQVDQKVPAVLFADYEMVQAEIMWVRNMGPYNPSNTAIIDFFNEYYGGGMGSVVFQTLRESKALAYGTYAFYGSPEKKGERYSMTAYIGCQADKLKDAVEGMNELFNKMPRSEKLIETSRKSIKNQYETQRFTEDEVIDEWFAAQELGLDRDIRPQVYAQFDQLDYPALLKFEKENIAGKPFTYCVVASSKKIKMDLLAKYGKVKRLKPEEIFGY